MSRSEPERWPISSGRSEKSGISWRDFDAAPHALGGLGEAAHRLGDGVGEEQRHQQHHARRDEEDAHDGPAFRDDDGVDVAAQGRQQQRAAHRPEALNGHGDGHDGLAIGVDAHHDGGGRRARPTSG